MSWSLAMTMYLLNFYSKNSKATFIEATLPFLLLTLNRYLIRWKIFLLCTKLFNSFSTNALFLYPLKTSENLRYRSGTLAENGLRITRRNQCNPVDTPPLLNIHPKSLVNLVNIFRLGLVHWKTFWSLPLVTPVLLDNICTLCVHIWLKVF